MGGPGSGKRPERVRRPSTDDCLSLDVNQLARDRILIPGWRGLLRWKSPWFDELLASIWCATTLDIHGNLTLRLNYALENNLVIQASIRILYSRPHFGGVRHWFRCPGQNAGACCSRRAAKLYLRGSYFLCRQCQDLRYRSRSP